MKELLKTDGDGQMCQIKDDGLWCRFRLELDIGLLAYPGSGPHKVSGQYSLIRD